MPIKKWNRQKIIGQIHILHSKKELLNAAHIYQKYPALSSAAERHFGSWRKAIYAAGFNYNKICLTTKWNKKKIINTIHKINSRNEPLNIGYIKNKYCTLYGAACSKRYFNNWKTAVSAAGFNYDKIRLTTKWDKKKIIDTIHKINSRNEPLNLSYIKQNYPTFLSAVLRNKEFNNWGKAIYAAGSNYNNICLKTKWDKKKIIDTIHKINSRNEPLNFRYVQQNYPSFLNAVLRNKKNNNWGKAIYAAGFNYNKICLTTKWNKKKIIDTIHKINSRNKPLNAGYIKNNYHALYSASCNKKYFNNWKTAVSAAGFNYNKISLRRKRNTQEILNEIKEIYEKHKCLKPNFIHKIKPYLLNAVNKNPNLKTWQKAVEKAGFNYYKVTNTNMIFWKKGKIVEEIKKLNKREIPLTEEYIMNYQKDLYIQAIKKTNFSNWDNALITAGINYNNILKENLLEKSPFVSASTIKFCSNFSLIQEHVKEYIDYERFVRKISFASLQTKKRILNVFKDYLLRRKFEHINSITTNLLRSYFAFLRDEKISEATINNTYSVLKLFFNYALRQKYLSQNPIIIIGKRKLGWKLPDILNELEYIRLFRYAKSNYTKNKFIKARNLLLLGLFLMAGLRQKEVILLDRKNISLSKKIIIINCKQFQRALPIPIPLYKIIKKYLSFRNQQSSPKLITTSTNSTPLSHAIIYKTIKSLAKGAKINKNIHPRNLRSSFAALFLNRGCNIIHLQRLLGHKNLTHTIKYIKFDLRGSRKNIELINY